MVRVNDGWQLWGRREAGREETGTDKRQRGGQGHDEWSICSCAEAGTVRCRRDVRQRAGLPGISSDCARRRRPAGRDRGFAVSVGTRGSAVLFEGRDQGGRQGRRSAERKFGKGKLKTCCSRGNEMGVSRDAGAGHAPALVGGCAGQGRAMARRVASGLACARLASPAGLPTGPRGPAGGPPTAPPGRRGRSPAGVRPRRASSHHLHASGGCSGLLEGDGGGAGAAR